MGNSCIAHPPSWRSFSSSSLSRHLLAQQSLLTVVRNHNIFQPFSDGREALGALPQLTG